MERKKPTNTIYTMKDIPRSVLEELDSKQDGSEPFNVDEFYYDRGISPVESNTDLEIIEIEQKKQLEVAFNAARKAYAVRLEIDRAEDNYLRPDGSPYRNNDKKKLKEYEIILRNQSKEALHSIIDSKLLESIKIKRNPQMKLADDLNRIAYVFYVFANDLDSEDNVKTLKSLF
ncbi:MAG: hypothetical protein WCH58_02935 [Candidatus Saccharibacteria bacterium]